MKITIQFRNDNPNTVWNVLARKLGREPTDKEAADEVMRILSECRESQLFGNSVELNL